MNCSMINTVQSINLQPFKLGGLLDTVPVPAASTVDEFAAGAGLRVEVVAGKVAAARTHLGAGMVIHLAYNYNR